MSPRGQLVLCVQVAILWLLALSGHSAGDQAPAAAAAAASADQITNVNDALKYLREIDKYYAQVARPSTRSEAINQGDEDLFKAKQALKMLRLQELDKLYTQRARPRFGKRTQLQLQSEKHNLDAAADCAEGADLCSAYCPAVSYMDASIVSKRMFCVFNPGQRQVHQWVRAQVPFKEIPNITSVWADGAILCVIVENALAPNEHSDSHTDKYKAYGHVTLPSIRLGQTLAYQYLNVQPEFKLEEMGKDADPEIILRLVKYLQHVKRASKAAKVKKPVENERRLALHERRSSAAKDEANKKAKHQKAEILRKKKIIHRKRRCSIRTPPVAEKPSATIRLSFSLLQDDDRKCEDIVAKCHEIQSVCEMLLVRGSRRKSLQIFNTATRILASRRSSCSSQTPEDNDKVDVGEQANKIDCGDPPTAIVAPREKKCQQQQQVEEEPPQKNQFATRARDNWQYYDTPKAYHKPEPRRPNSPVEHSLLGVKATSPRASSPRLDFSNTDFSLAEKPDVASADSSRRSSLKDANANYAQLPDIANLNISQDSNDGIFFARRLSNNLQLEDFKVDNPLFEGDKKEKESEEKHSDDKDTKDTTSYKAYNGVKARRKFFQEAAAAAAEPKAHCAPAAPVVAAADGAKDETKKRYEQVKNFFRNMEQNSSEERRELFLPRSNSRRSSDTTSMALREAPQIIYMSCRVKKAKEAPPHVDQIFDPQESRKIVKTMSKPDVSAVMASLNSAFEQQQGRSRSPYDIVREGEYDDDSAESAGSPEPDLRVPDLVQRRVSFSELNQQGDAGIF